MPNLLINSFNLPLAIAAANHEVIGKAAYLSGIKQHDIARLLITSHLYRLMRQFYCVQKLIPQDIYTDQRTFLA